ncbi:hypothetical protein [Streptomyces malaysiensis]|uniref:hypothetical protein n=1 Tax=Streptomyces malaysiensis TaxID=92644 RepID=UPI00368209D9
MDRVYTNHRSGERRIHVEIEEAEIADLLAEFTAPDSGAARRLVEILEVARRRFTVGGAS